MILTISSLAMGQWQMQRSDIKAEFRGLSAADEKTAWAGGSRNTFARTTDGGTTWETGTVPEKEVLDFRDVEGVDGQTAYLLSIGNGTKSRIYKTRDGGKTWDLQFLNEDPKAFYDAFAFWDERNGIAVGDPVDGRFTVLRTSDGGAHWIPLRDPAMPPALDGEGVFAASGTTITVQGAANVWFATGATTAARVFRSTDKGGTWTVSATPMTAGPSAGIFSIAFRDGDNGIIVGGDYRKVEEAKDNIARTSDGGRTWQLVADSGIGGFRSCVAYIPGGRGRLLLATGPAGTDYSTDGGVHWMRYDAVGFHVLSFARSGAGAWGAGAGGRIARFVPFP
jgi:photosystem II stability/assembly factor-like uncharacterized protein